MFDVFCCCVRVLVCVCCVRVLVCVCCETGLVAAARSSINQMTNCVCAWLLYRCYTFGRPVEGIGLKLLSTAVVGVGLLLGSTGGGGGTEDATAAAAAVGGAAARLRC